MELIKNIVIDFCLFGIWEGIIYYYFIRRIYKCENNIKLIFIIAICNSISTNLILPIIYHFIIILYIGFIIYKNSKYNFMKSLKLSGIMILIISCIEMMYSIFFEIFFGIDVYKNIDFYILLLISFSIKIIEFLMIHIFGGTLMKVFIGEVRK